MGDICEMDDFRILRQINEDTDFIFDFINKNQNVIEIISPEGYHLYANKRFIDRYGAIPPKDHNVLEVVIQKNREIPHIKERLLKGEPITLPTRHINPRDYDPSYPNISSWCRLTIHPIVDHEEKVRAFLLFDEDFTQIKKLERVIYETQRFDSINKAVTGLIHDINNQLTVIVGNLGLVKLETEDEDQSNTTIRSTIGACEEGLMDIHKLLKEVMKYSRGTQPIKEEVSIKTILDDALKTKEHQTGITFTIKSSDHFPSILANRMQIQQTLSNILDNAIDAMEGEGTIEICIDKMEINENNPLNLSPGDYLEISIHDHGGGIPEETLDNLFIPFYTTKSKGHGLGLYISYSIVKNHNGIISVESTPNQGTTVHIFLPTLPMR